MALSSTYLVSVLLAIFLAVPAQSMRCQETTIRHFVNCADSCFSFIAPDLLDRIDSCKAKSRFGCLLDNCPSGAGFECKHDPDHPFAVCGNDKTVFDSFNIDQASQKTPLKFMVDVNAPPLKVQYYFLVDTTKSMSPHIHDVKKKIKELVDMYDTMPEIDASFALGEYRDPLFRGAAPPQQNGQCGLRVIRGFTNDKARIKSDVDGLVTSTTEGNGPEGLLPSIAQAGANSGWSAGARKILIVFGDAPGYEPTKHDLFWMVTPTFPFTIDRSHVGKLLHDNDVVYIGVSFGDNGLDASTDPRIASRHATLSGPGQSTYLASQTGGVVTSASTTLMQAVIDAKESYEREYTMDASGCSPKLVINDGQEFRVRLKPSEQSVVDMKMVLNDAFCDPFKCEIKYFEDGIELVPLGMHFLKIDGCPPV